MDTSMDITMPEKSRAGILPSLLALLVSAAAGDDAAVAPEEAAAGAEEAAAGTEDEAATGAEDEAATEAEEATGTEAAPVRVQVQLPVKERPKTALVYPCVDPSHIMLCVVPPGYVSTQADAESHVAVNCSFKAVNVQNPTTST
jgi:hypothetical protein